MFLKVVGVYTINPAHVKEATCRVPAGTEVDPELARDLGAILMEDCADEEYKALYEWTVREISQEEYEKTRRKQ